MHICGHDNNPAYNLLFSQILLHYRFFISQYCLYDLSITRNASSKLSHFLFSVSFNILLVFWFMQAWVRKLAFSALTLLVGHPACKNIRVVVCLERGADLHYGPADATATHCLLLQ